MLLFSGRHFPARSSQDCVALIEQAVNHIVIEPDSFLDSLVKLRAGDHVVQGATDLIQPLDVARVTPVAPR